MEVMFLLGMAMFCTFIAVWDWIVCPMLYGAEADPEETGSVTAVFLTSFGVIWAFYLFIKVANFL